MKRPTKPKVELVTTTQSSQLQSHKARRRSNALTVQVKGYSKPIYRIDHQGFRRLARWTSVEQAVNSLLTDWYLYGAQPGDQARARVLGSKLREVL